MKFRFKQCRAFVGAMTFCLSIAPVSAHEFWIEPLAFQIAEDQPLSAHNRVGQTMRGEPYPYAASTFAEFSITDPAETRTVRGRLGDLPALVLRPEREGLHIAAYQSVPSTTRYRSAEKFETFLHEEGLLWVRDAHRKRGLPEKGFSEAFTRFAKSMIAVGGGAGEDTGVGFRFELIAETNPYTDDGPMRVQLMFEGDPHADAQLSIFCRDDAGAVTHETVQTDAEGRAVIPQRPGVTVLLNAVHMVEPSPPLMIEKRVLWHSLWASLTFRFPQ